MGPDRPVTERAEARFAAESEGGDKVLAFVAGGLRRALAAHRVREIASLPRLTPVPFGAEGLLGLGNFRGRIVPVLALDGTDDAAASRVLLLDGERPVALAVEAVLGLEARDGETLDLDALLAASFPAPARRSATSAPLAAAVQEAGEQEMGRDDRVALLAMELAGQRFALPADEVEAVLKRPADQATVPGARGAALGAIEYRDRLLPLFSLAALLGFETRPKDAGRKEYQQVVVVPIGGGKVGLVVDRVCNVLQVAPDRLEPVPGVLLRNDAEAAIRAICRPGGGERLISVLDADHLLDAETTTALRTLAPARSLSDGETQAGEQQSWLAFHAGEHRLAMPLGAVDGVARVPALAAVPDAPEWLAGLASLHGAAVPVIDLSVRLGSHADGAGTKDRRLVLARHGGDPAGLLVDRIDGLIDLSRHAIERPEAGGAADATFEGYARLTDDAEGERIALLVSPWTLIDAAGRALLARAEKAARP
jgi:purine-binding chemotaxis protein CheW